MSEKGEVFENACDVVESTEGSLHDTVQGVLASAEQKLDGPKSSTESAEESFQEKAKEVAGYTHEKYEKYVHKPTRKVIEACSHFRQARLLLRSSILGHHHQKK